MMLTFGKCGTATSNNSKIHELLKMSDRKCEKHEHCTSRNFNECLVLGTPQNVRQKVRETRALHLHIAELQRVSRVGYYSKCQTESARNTSTARRETSTSVSCCVSHVACFLLPGKTENLEKNTHSEQRRKALNCMMENIYWQKTVMTRKT